MRDVRAITRRTFLTGAAAAAALATTRVARGEAPAPAPRIERMPAAFVGHGSPMTAVDAARGKELRGWAEAIGKPQAILCVSAHYERRPLTIGATTKRALIYDFGGFPRELYRLTYPAPGAGELATGVAKRLAGVTRVQRDARRGHDHGTWVPLRWMYPDADVPVLSVSLPGHDPKTLFRVGRALGPLRDEGVLILGSGMLTHNLRHRGRPGAKPPTWSSEFDAWAKRVIDTNDVDQLLDWQRKAPAARTNHPTVEHFVPLVLALGARRASDKVRYPIVGFSGSMSRRSVSLA